MLRISLCLAVIAFGSLGCSGCFTAAEGEGEGAAAGEGEGVAGGEGEGEGVAGGEGEGEGEGEGTQCPPPAATCTTTPTSSLSFNVPGTTEPSLVVDNGAPIAIGDTRANIEAAIGTGVNDQNNAFHVDYCDGGFQLQYVDGDGTFDQASSTGAATDVVARIATLAGAAINPPAQVADVTFTTATTVVTITSSSGLEELSNNGNVSEIVLFRPQPAPAPWTLATDLKSGEQKLGTLADGSSTFVDVQNVLGSAFDADGQSVIDLGGFGSITIRTLIYASTGIRVAGLCGNDCTDGNVTLNTIALSAPFFGVDANNIGLGAAEADIDALNLGAKSGPDNAGVTVYGTSQFGQATSTGVVYVQDTSCTERAAAFILGYSAQ